MRAAALALACAALGGLARAAEAPPLVQVAPQSEEDSVGTHWSEGVLTVDIASPFEIGAARVRLLEGKWPARVRLRFSGFATLESLRVQAGPARLRCSALDLGADRIATPCRVDGAPAASMTAGSDYREVELPAALLDGAQRLDLEWVRRWPR